ncbi:unnamed protein product [Medioppia subpectinata]|uniref:Glutathione peroxidase n=1 Tax=Medioppia subpectinata TaxID=1979941 RepID=A0A7R9KU43_9ACAR|nr:unnamed protein product [Medioppia subpectinata]CAG2109866.1 unnamed protein product [Medioppia subpectinata]
MSVSANALTHVFLTLFLWELAVSTAAADNKDWKNAKTLYEFTAVKDIDGNDVNMEKYKGHPVLVVNVASNCGLTDTNYRQLQALYAQYAAKGLRVCAFPTNEFLSQEPGTNTQIKEFADKYNVTFDMMAKIKVNGDDAHPLYKWLKEKQGGYLGFDGIKWNFTKFLIDQKGIPIKRYAPTISPNDIESDIKSLLYKEL